MKGTPTIDSTLERLKENKTSNDDFVRSWLMIAISTFLCPPTSLAIRPRCYLAIVDLSCVKKLNWCQFVVDQLKDAVAKMGKRRSFKGCLLVLVVSCFASCFMLQCLVSAVVASTTNLSHICFYFFILSSYVLMPSLIFHLCRFYMQTRFWLTMYKSLPPCLELQHGQGNCWIRSSSQTPTVMAHLGSSRYVSIGQCGFPFVTKVSPCPHYNFAYTCLCVQLKGSSYSTPQPSLFHMDDIRRFVSSKVPSGISDQVCLFSNDVLMTTSFC